MKPMYKGEQTDTATLEEEVKVLQEQRDQDTRLKDEDPDIKEAVKASEDSTLPEGESNWAKRYGDLRRKEQESTVASKEREQALEKTIEELKANQVSSLPTSEADLERFREEHPEVFDVISTVSAKQAGSISETAVKSLEEKVTQLEKEKQDLAKKDSVSVIKDAHPDYSQLETDAEFHKWVETRGGWIADSIYRSINPQGAIDAINLYKQEKGLLTPPAEETKRGPGRPRKSEEDIAAAKSVSKSTTTSPDGSPVKKKTWKASEIKNMSDKDFMENAEDIRLAAREGRFDQDS